MNHWPMLGVLIIVLGFVLRFNAVLVVVTGGVVSGLLAGYDVPDLLALIGESFVANRALLLIALTLPAVGVLERCGLREYARHWIGRLRGLNLTRLLVAYLGLRQLLSMLGMTNVAGHPQTVRPMLAPMSETAFERDKGAPATPEELARVRALAAATDNVGLFFGEDVFIALGAVLLIQGFYASHGIVLQPLAIALWALPTAIGAFVIHGLRLAVARRRLLARYPGQADAAD
ncbi:MAG TPA: DUF969 family protein [Frateuria sp.]|uniref:5-oxoproline transporter, DUF969 family subunit n=1 Tax=Frateuria sp. TaxID=2211372 RepID=UPI002D7E518B|nr:DUF969 family protein [Frateuria sp.]HET6806533.1 DUF969 family protein [Frateuria sp.]